MSSARESVAGQVELGGKLIEMCTRDLTDDEYFQPPVQGLNHTAWLLLHIAVVWDKSMSALANTQRRLPESMHGQFRSGSQPLSDSTKYPLRAKIDAIFWATHSLLLRVLQSEDDSTWRAPSPEGFPKDLFPTVGAAWSLQATHLFWHLGQVLTCRAAMEKKHVLA